jgi:excinuclease ABC subunit C
MDFDGMLKRLPQKPGVYMMFDSLGNIIYIGKAKNLKNRVSQYFMNNRDRTPKITEMIQNIHSFNYEVTDTEFDALIEECRLIREIQPRYNKLMKNYRRYLYIKIAAEQYPKVTQVNEKMDDGAYYFGPFTSPHQVETTVKYLNEFYPLRKCASPGLVQRKNGCLFLELGTCLGVCTGQISPVEYKKYIDKIRELLSGNYQDAIQELTHSLDGAIESLEFEKAARFREYILGLQHVIKKQRLVYSSGKNRNILAIERIDSSRVKLFLIKGNKLLDRIVINQAKTDKRGLQCELKQLLRDKFAQKNIRSELAHQDIDEAQIIYSYLKSNKKRIRGFWIPSTQLVKETSRLDDTIAQIINDIKRE